MMMSINHWTVGMKAVSSVQDPARKSFNPTNEQGSLACLPPLAQLQATLRDIKHQRCVSQFRLSFSLLSLLSLLSRVIIPLRAVTYEYICSANTVPRGTVKYLVVSKAA